MPCPPSYEEQQFTRIHIDLDRYSPRLKKMVAEIRPCLMTVDRLKEILQRIVGPETPVPEPIKAVSDLEELEKTDLDAILKYPKLSGGYPTDEDLDILHRHSSKIQHAHDLIELNLCEVRTMIGKLWNKLRELDYHIPEELNGALQREKELHLIHREEDRAEALRRLKSMITFHKGQIRMARNTGKGDPEAHQAKIDALEKRIPLLQAIDSEAMLVDRTAFFFVNDPV